MSFCRFILAVKCVKTEKNAQLIEMQYDMFNLIKTRIMREFIVLFNLNKMQR